MTAHHRTKRPNAVQRLGALRIVDRDAWAREVREAMIAHDCIVARAAPALGVSLRTLFRYLNDPALRDVAARTQPGRPIDTW